MAVCEFHLNQINALEKMTSFTAIVPDDMPGPFPVFYLLHGLSDDHTAWTRRTSIERYVGGLPLIVVMPNGERGFYTDSRSNPKAAYETNLVHDIVGFVDRTFRTDPHPRRPGHRRAFHGRLWGGQTGPEIPASFLRRRQPLRRGWLRPSDFCTGGRLGTGMASHLRRTTRWRPGRHLCAGREVIRAISRPCGLTAAWTIFFWKKTAPSTPI